ncbi:hypothetical protein NG796_25920 [Laspinema sp. A4]|uniref:hypothetical protein n=1 Tax=Laspinema sp. D2d TaxID=2953686 RepID=UPI0021BAAF18|nr:hypothetical protein [Laspinema sp. D2d]MCT7986716.1 hypothetical protein [Laspinema sp. D2d]
MTTLEKLILESLQTQRRLPQSIQKYLNQTYYSLADLEDIETTLQQLEADGKVRRYKLPSGQETDMWELVRDTV